MPLTFTPDESEERRRKMYGDLAASGDKAMGYGFDALSKMETMAKEKAVLERQSGLDADLRAKTAADLTLRQKADQRDATTAAAKASRDAFDLEQARGRATRDAEDRTLTLHDGAAKRTEAERARMRQIMKEAVAAGVVDGQDPDAISTALQNREDVQPFAPGMLSLLDVDAEYDAQRAQRAKDDTEMGLKQSQIDENNAQALNAARAPTGKAPVDPEIAAARKRKALADADAAEGRVPDAVVKHEDERRAKGEMDLKKRQVVEVDNYVANIKDNIATLRQQVKDKGTFEATGTGSQDMERWLTGIATDLAKLADPGSVAREGEVALQRRGLFDPNTLSMTNATALQILDNLDAEVGKRRANAYRIRGLQDASAPVVGEASAQGTAGISDDEVAKILGGVDWGAM